MFLILPSTQQICLLLLKHPGLLLDCLFCLFIAHLAGLVDKGGNPGKIKRGHDAYQILLVSAVFPSMEGGGKVIEDLDPEFGRQEKVSRP